MPVCNSVLITNFAEKTTKDGIMLKLEHPSIGGEDSVENIDLQENNKYAVVHLENPDGKDRYECYSVLLEKISNNLCTTEMQVLQILKGI